MQESSATASSLSGTESVLGLASDGMDVFLGLQWSGGLKIVDASTPTSPVYVGSGFATRDEPWGIVVSGNRAFLGERRYGVQTLDITDLANPSLHDEYNTGGDPHWGIEVSGDLVYLADGPSGVKIFSVVPLPAVSEWGLVLLVLLLVLAAATILIRSHRRAQEI